MCYLVWFQVVQPDLISAQLKQAQLEHSIIDSVDQSLRTDDLLRLDDIHDVKRDQSAIFKERTILRQSITKDVVTKSDKVSHEVLARQNEDDLFFFKNGVDTIKRNTTVSMHNLFISKNPSLTDKIKISGLLSVAATKDLSSRLSLREDQLRLLSNMKSIPQPKFPCPFVTHRCNPGAKYRTADGSCNNLKHSIWGKVGTPLQRFLSPFYDDGVSEPRTTSVFGTPLPSARLVSTSVHEPDSSSTQHNIFSHMVMQWGQFINHDMTNTPVETGYGNSDISCCINNANKEVIQRLKRRKSCFPIPIPPNDRHFKSKCLNFVRSLPAPNSNCKFGGREQLNQITSFIDGGAVYGNSKNDQSQLRSHVKGQMKESFPHLLPKDPQRSCVVTSTNNYCFKAGDRRVNEQMGLASIHTLFLREHNRIAHQLSNMGLGWNDEKLFQETKRIVAAIIQRINYNEFLPTILNTKIIKALGLQSPSSGFHDVYRPKVDPSIRNAFSTAAFRFGHSMARSFFTKLSPDFNTAFGSPVLLKTMFGKTDEILRDKVKSVGAFFRGLLKDKSQKCDRFISTQLTDHLFEDNFGNSLDLAALNIQRGRDHGLPPYNIWRQSCGFSKVNNFGTKAGGLVDHSSAAASRIKSVYDHPDDIDLFTGGLSENPIQDGAVGPTFACIISRQFLISKIADRFWYERKDPTVGFTLKQLDQIRKMTLSKLICLNTDISQIQRNPFHVSGTKNPLVPCNSLPIMDLSAWKSCQQNTWEAWTPWSKCISGQQASRRKCVGAAPPIGCGCKGLSVKIQMCSNPDCEQPSGFDKSFSWILGRCRYD